jgi:hypothetical protein
MEAESISLVKWKHIAHPRGFMPLCTFCRCQDAAAKDDGVDDMPNSKRPRWFSAVKDNGNLETCSVANDKSSANVKSYGLAQFLLGDQGYPNIGMRIVQFLSHSGFLSMWQTCSRTKLLLERASCLNWQFPSSRNALMAWYTFQEHIPASNIDKDFQPIPPICHRHPPRRFGQHTAHKSRRSRLQRQRQAASAFRKSIFQHLLSQANQVGPKLWCRLCHDFSKLKYDIWTDLMKELFQLGHLQAVMCIDDHHPMKMVDFANSISPDEYPLHITDEFVNWASLRIEQQWDSQSKHQCVSLMFLICLCARNGSAYAHEVAKSLCSDQLPTIISDHMDQDQKDDELPYFVWLYQLALEGKHVVRPYALEIALMCYPLKTFLNSNDAALNACIRDFVINHKWNLLPSEVLIYLKENDGIFPFVLCAAQVNYVSMVAKYKNHASKWTEEKQDVCQDTCDHWFLVAFVNGHVEVCEELAGVKSYLYAASSQDAAADVNNDDDSPCYPTPERTPEEKVQAASRLLNAYWRFEITTRPKFNWEKIELPRTPFPLDMGQAIQEYITNGKWEQFQPKICQFIQGQNT